MTAPFRVIVMGGEGIGPEVTAQAVRVLEVVRDELGLAIELEAFEVGAAAFARTGQHLPPEARAACDRGQRDGRAAILFGAVAEEPIGQLRQDYDLFANLRPIRLLPPLVDVSPLRRERVAHLDLLIVRELVGDVYFGPGSHGTGDTGRWAAQPMYYDERLIRRIVRTALGAARARRRRLTLVHKANVIPHVFGLWHDVLAEERRGVPEVACDDILVDNMAAQMVIRPADFDVVLCSNMFGDILSDLGGGLLGSIGLLPSASLNERGFALYEPVGGTAPALAGRDVANPVAAILSAALMCRYSLGDEGAAALIERATEDVLAGHRTADVHQPGLPQVGTAAFGALVADRARALAREPR